MNHNFLTEHVASLVIYPTTASVGSSSTYSYSNSIDMSAELQKGGQPHTAAEGISQSKGNTAMDNNSREGVE